MDEMARRLERKVSNFIRRDRNYKWYAESQVDKDTGVVTILGSFSNCGSRIELQVAKNDVDQEYYIRVLSFVFTDGCGILGPTKDIYPFLNNLFEQLSSALELVIFTDYEVRIPIPLYYYRYGTYRETDEPLYVNANVFFQMINHVSFWQKKLSFEGYDEDRPAVRELHDLLTETTLESFLAGLHSNPPPEAVEYLRARADRDEALNRMSLSEIVRELHDPRITFYLCMILETEFVWPKTYMFYSWPLPDPSSSPLNIRQIPKLRLTKEHYIDENPLEVDEEDEEEEEEDLLKAILSSSRRKRRADRELDRDVDSP